MPTCLDDTVADYVTKQLCNYTQLFNLRDAPCGSIWWKVLVQGGRVLDEGPGKFELAFHGWSFADENSDGIFEPGSSITFSNFQVKTDVVFEICGVGAEANASIA